MGYTVETSLPINSGPGEDASALARRNLAARHGCSTQYFTHLAEGRGKATHFLSVVHTAFFPASSLDTVIGYVREARALLRVRVGCVYAEDGACTMLYASGKYLRQMSREQAKSIRSQIRDRLSEPGVSALCAACSGRPPPKQRGENMSAVYTDVRPAGQQVGQDGEECQSDGGSMHIPLQVQEGDSQRLHRVPERKGVRNPGKS